MYVVVRRALFKYTDVAQRLTRTLTSSLDAHHNNARSHSELSRQLIELLHAAVPDADPPTRRKLLLVKRAVYNGRDAREQVIELIDRDPESDLSIALRAYMARTSALSASAVEIDRVLTRSVGEMIHATREIVKATALSDTVATLSPTLASRIESWIVAGRADEESKLLYTVTRYLYRGALKTSPAGEFLVSTLVSPETGRSGPNPRQGPRLSAIELSPIGLPEAILEVALSTPSDVLPLAINSTLATNENHHLFLVNRAGKEAVIALPVSPLADFLIERLRESRELSEGILLEAAARQFGSSTATVQEVLQTLRTCGAIEVVAGRYIDPYTAANTLEAARELAPKLADPVASILSECAPHPMELRGPTKERQTRVVGKIAQLALADVHEGTRSYLSSVEAASLAVTGSVRGAPESPESDVMKLSSPGEWREALESYRRWLAPFLPGWAGRLLLGELLGDSLEGAGLPLLEVYRRLWGSRWPEPAGSSVASFFGDTQSPFRGLSPFAAVRFHQDAQQRAVMALQEAYSARVPVEDKECDSSITLAPSDLKEVIGHYPDWLRPPASLDIFLQFASDTESSPSNKSTLLVMNDLVSGFGKTYNHVAALLGSPTRWCWEAGSDNRIFADIGGRFGSTLNDRRCAFSHVIPYPSGKMRSPSSEEIPVSDLRVKSGGAGIPTLYSYSRGTEVVPVFTGTMAFPLLPRLARLLIVLGCQSPPVHPVPLHKLWRMERADTGAVLPRIVLGPVVLRRRTVVIPVSRMPRRSAFRSIGEYIRVMSLWAREAGLPRSGFVRSLEGLRLRPIVEQDKWRKPMYFSFDEPLTVLSMDDALPHYGETIGFQEALPSPSSEPAVEYATTLVGRP